jgi:hypothetical protein
VEQLTVSAVFSLLVLVLCLVRPNAGRIFVGIFFLQHVAMRMDRMAPWSDESLLRRPP